MKNKIKLGIFFIVTFVIFVGAIVLLGKIKVRGDGYRIYVDYVFIGDLQENGKVSYRGGGIQIGFIEKIAINPDGTIRVTLFITDKNVIIPDGTKFSIQTVGLGLGEKYIMVSPPAINTTGMKSMAPNTIVKGVEPFSIETTLGSIGDIGKDLNFQELSVVVSNLSQTINLISGVIVSNEANINNSISNASATLGYINNIARDLSYVINDVEKGQGTIGAIMKDPKVHTNFNEIVDNLRVFTEKIKGNPSLLLFRETDTKK
ncbi:MlaD family protein [Brachyspira hyodysenteriae]|uniref:MlaD family protein n=1 Tax=Brachyspira hyodysenteriae TaxID=159 RepID=UPI0022CD3C45|nr:MlaD family protein [Brachyspira hyodysenteriae]MCZ9869256.1 MlaD family protein [Brachyspira hyodysenteriae]MCZ9877748.1 MlaD family protein [Brachyspira hyodysenteriae]MCZ9899202.1 MlaD family protein [Brachyspira hyodysenteriae]MCZ9952433.1 MlaD family protein [Brachyspira hyodysenteriae]MCZ9971826.1 MlaD family protein [Brachyspira hyodysenteriae]